MSDRLQYTFVAAARLSVLGNLEPVTEAGRIVGLWDPSSGAQYEPEVSLVRYAGIDDISGRHVELEGSGPLGLSLITTFSELRSRGARRDARATGEQRVAGELAVPVPAEVVREFGFHNPEVFPGIRTVPMPDDETTIMLIGTAADLRELLLQVRAFPSEMRTTAGEAKRLRAVGDAVERALRQV